MKPTGILTLTLLLAVAVSSSQAQTTQKLTANKLSEYGLTYTLPLTEFEVTLAAQKTVKTPGEFALYARKYLNAEPILRQSVSWTLTAAEIIPVAFADEDERYLVQFKSGTTPFVRITSDGFPVALNDDDYQPAVVASPSLKAAAAQPTILELPVAKQAVTEEMLRSTSSAKRAELAAARIYEIRQNRSDLISGQADNMPKDGVALQLALDNLAQQEEALTAMFLGTTATSTEVATYSVIPPEGDDPEKVVVARISALKGLTQANDLSGDPVYVSFSQIVTADMPENEKGQPKTFPRGGVAYRIPGSALVTVSYDGHTLCRTTADIAQYGVVFGIDPALFVDKKAPAYMRFAPLTGAIVEFGSK